MEGNDPKSIDDEEDGDFGDFQACDSANESSSLQQQQQQPKINILKQEAATNVFDLNEDSFDKFADRFETELISLFPSSSPLLNEGNHLIRSQEDIINDCPIWCSLTGSFKCQPLLDFKKSKTFQHYIKSLALGRKFLNHQQQQQRQSNVTIDKEDETLIKLDRFEEEDMANDLDMHSLIIGSYEQQLDMTEADQVPTADQVIDKIERYFDNENETNDVYVNGTAKEQCVQNNPLLSLNASSLLDAVLKSWKEEHQSYTIEDDEEGEYYSLPINLQQSMAPLKTLTSSINEQYPNKKEVTLSLKESNIYLNEKMSSTNETMKDSMNTNSNGINSMEMKSMDEHSSLQSECFDKLRQLNIVQLNELYIEIEQIIQYKSEILCQELAIRDELKYEKELKNNFISLLLSVQNKQRHYISNNETINNKHIKRSLMKKRAIGGNNNNNGRNVDIGRRGSMTGNDRRNTGNSLISRALDLSLIKATFKESFNFTTTTPTPVYLTTVIPYRKSMNPIDIATLQMLIKLLTALNENSSKVPALLADYILKVVCT